MSECPPCKVIIDGLAALMAAAIALAVRAFAEGRAALAGAAAGYAVQVHGNIATFRTAMENGAVTSAELDEWHAWSELDCHRAAALREMFSASNRAEDPTRISTIRGWSEESRLFATRMVGGEYNGPGFTVNGTKGIVPKESGGKRKKE